MKELRIAKSAGFCFGVRRSVEMAERLIEEKGGCACLGMLIHNEDVVAELEHKGMRVINDPTEAKPGEPVLIRAHGASGETYKRLEQAGAEIHDATCPKVKGIHKIVAATAENGEIGRAHV